MIHINDLVVGTKFMFKHDVDIWGVNQSPEYTIVYNYKTYKKGVMNSAFIYVDLDDLRLNFEVVVKK